MPLPFAPGRPGIEVRESTGEKTGVGVAFGPPSRVYFTLGEGIVDEVYFPSPGNLCVREIGLVVTGEEYFSEEKRDTRRRLRFLVEGCPAYHLINENERYRIEKEIIADPRRDCLLQSVHFAPRRGRLGDYRLHVLLAPFSGGATAWSGEYKGVPMLFAGRGDHVLALASSVRWLRRSVGFVGLSDPWHELSRHKRLSGEYTRAENGSVVLAGEIPLVPFDGTFFLVTGFGMTEAEAGYRARASLREGFEPALTRYINEWRGWQNETLLPDAAYANERDLFRISKAVIRIHESKRFPGGIIPSLAVPWERSRTGYHLVWGRDLARAGRAYVAAGALEDALRVIRYYAVTQEEDGHWPQSMLPSGSAFWHGAALEETGLAVLLVDLARRDGILDEGELRRLWPMVRRSAGYIVRSGPVSPEARWEEDPGYSPSTLAIEIAALLAAARFADFYNDPAAGYLRDTADAWNAAVERWTYVTGSGLDRRLGVAGHYAHIASAESASDTSFAGSFPPIRLHPPGLSRRTVAHVVSADALDLVRYGLRSPEDPRIRDTVTVIDAVLKCDTSRGPAWRRFNDDGYGEHPDGRPFGQAGTGHPWPLLTGERAHFELLAGNRGEAIELLKAMESFANEGEMLPEQVWDGPDIPERGLSSGRPTGSAAPLVAAHAEYLLLRRSLHEGKVFDLPPQTVQRYIAENAASPYMQWRFNNKSRIIEKGKTLRIEVLAPATVRWTDDGWHHAKDSATRDTGIGVHVLDIPTGAMPPGTMLQFTFFWTEKQRWEGADFTVKLGQPYHEEAQLQPAAARR